MIRPHRTPGFASLAAVAATLTVVGLAAAPPVFLAPRADAQAQAAVTDENLSDEHIRAAISALVEELYRRQAEQTHWEPRYSGEFESRQRGGWTALVTLALLYAGESYQDERLSSAIEYLQDVRMEGTYAVSIRAHVWAMLPPRFDSLLRRDRQWLMEAFSEQAAGWNYGKEPYTNRRDNSITQYGVLALWEAAKRGERIEPRYWRLLEDRFLAMQLVDGGWNYTGAGPATGSMSAAGLTVLFITQDFLHAADSVRLGRGDQQTSRNQRAIDLGLQWFERNFSPLTNPGRELDYYYYLYGVERVGLASGYQYFGGRDWFREGAVELIRRLCRWDPHERTMTVYQTLAGDPNAGDLNTVDLSFALMFLSRGRVPGAINKLSDASFRWNNRPRDVANLTTHLRMKTEWGLNWKIVDIGTAPEAWLDAPLLYIASNAAPPWMPQTDPEAAALIRRHREVTARRINGEVNDEADADPGLPLQLLKLKQYLDLGGMMLANAEGRSRAFAEAVERAGRVMYPDLEWHDLPEDHPIYTMHDSVPARSAPLRALSNGVRELIVLSPTLDLSETYQAASDPTREAFRLGANLYLYASEMNDVRPRLAQHVLDGHADRFGATPVRLLRAAHRGSWNAEPRALDVFSAWAFNERGLDVQIDTAPLETIHQRDQQPALVIVSGVDQVEFTDEELDAVIAFAESGGLILFETVGGRGDFTVEVERALRDRLNHPVRSLVRHPIISGEGVSGAMSLGRVEYRPFSFTVFGAREVAPRIRGMMFGETAEPRILFSREDLSHALLDQPAWGVVGYKPHWARNLLGNVVAYSRTLQEPQ